MNFFILNFTLKHNSPKVSPSNNSPTNLKLEYFFMITINYSFSKDKLCMSKLNNIQLLSYSFFLSIDILSKIAL